jgi:hypothetical protein
LSDERLRIPIDAPYLHVTGLALICFARLEWSAVWCCEKLQPGYLGTIQSQRKTPGTIANDFAGMTAAHADPDISSNLGSRANEFRNLVKRRNDLMHAKPETASTGEQRLFRNGTEWTIVSIEALADEFAALDIALNDFFHRVLCK